MAKRIVFLFFLFMLVFCISYADTLTLKSGEQIEGKIIERTNKLIKIEIASAGFTYYADEIDNVNGEKFSLPDVVPNESRAVSVGSSSIKSGNPYLNSNEEKSSRMPKFTPGQKKIAAAVTIGVMLTILFFVLVVYIYASICLQLIAKKTGSPDPWLAWIPVANVFLMCKIAGLSYWWLLVFLLSFIPVLGMLCNMAISGYIWYKIALARNKPGWIGAISIVPLVGLITMGYLAFSD